MGDKMDYRRNRLSELQAEYELRNGQLSDAQAGSSVAEEWRVEAMQLRAREKLLKFIDGNLDDLDIAFPAYSDDWKFKFDQLVELSSCGCQGRVFQRFANLHGEGPYVMLTMIGYPPLHGKFVLAKESVLVAVVEEIPEPIKVTA